MGLSPDKWMQFDMRQLLSILARRLRLPYADVLEEVGDRDTAIKQIEITEGKV